MKIRLPENTADHDARGDLLGPPERAAVDSDVARILPSLYVGAAPKSETDVAELKAQLGITAVLNLQTDTDFDALDLVEADIRRWYRDQGVELERVPIQDWSPDAVIVQMEEALATLHRLLEGGHTVYLHCTAGVNRSPSIALAYLSRAKGMPLEDALAIVTQHRPQADPYEAVLFHLRGAAGISPGKA